MGKSARPRECLLSINLHSCAESIWTSWRFFSIIALAAKETNEEVCGVTLTGLWITLPLDLYKRNERKDRNI